MLRLGIVIAVALLVLLTAFLVVSKQSTSSPQLRIQVAKVLSDGVDSPAGMVYYLLDVSASNNGPGIWHFNPALLFLTSNASSSYYASTGYTSSPGLGQTDIGAGQNAVGEVVFELPMNQRPASLAYTDTTGAIDIATDIIPEVSGTATKFDPSVHYVFTGTAASSAIATWAAITNQTNALAFFGGESGFRNYDFVFFTGQHIYVTFTFYYYKYPYDPNTITLRAVTSSDGYNITELVAWPTPTGFPGSSAAHPLPANLTGYGAETSVTLLVRVPAGHPSGVLHFVVQWSS